MSAFNREYANIHSAESTILLGNYEVRQELETRQLASKQDHVASGMYETDGKQTFWSAVFDGHGNSSVINIIREIDQARMNAIMSEYNPAATLQKEIDLKNASLSEMQQIHSGSTMVYAKVTILEKHNKIQIGNVGDSQACVVVNGLPIFVSEMHNSNNGKEMVRLLTEKRLDTREPIIRSGPNFDVLGPDTICARTGTHLNFSYTSDFSGFVQSTQLSPSQSLGHKSITGISPEITTIFVKKTDNFQVILASDGITDVLPLEGIGSDENITFCSNSTAHEIVNEAEKRWKKEWDLMNDNDLRQSWKTSFPANGYDDCCCARITYCEKEEILTEIPLDSSNVQMVTVAYLDEAYTSTVVGEIDEGFSDGEIAKEEYRLEFCS